MIICRGEKEQHIWDTAFSAYIAQEVKAVGASDAIKQRRSIKMIAVCAADLAVELHREAVQDAINEWTAPRRPKKTARP